MAMTRRGLLGRLVAFIAAPTIPVVLTPALAAASPLASTPVFPVMKTVYDESKVFVGRGFTTPKFHHLDEGPFVMRYPIAGIPKQLVR